jgi:hypothetical protein
MGRKKLARLRAVAHERGWLAPEGALPDDAVLATRFARPDGLPRQCGSGLERWRDPIAAWRDGSIQGATIHAALVRRHGYTGSYSSVHRFLSRLPPSVAAEVPLRLHFAPAATFPERTLWLHRAQTREEGRALYFRDHALVPDGYSLLCYLLRGVRSERVTRVDVKLIHLLFGMQAWMRAVGIRQPLRANHPQRIHGFHHEPPAAPAARREPPRPGADRPPGESRGTGGSAAAVFQRRTATLG